MNEQKSRIVTIPYPSEDWSWAMANANRADKEFMPLRFKGKKLQDLKELLAKEMVDKKKTT